MGQRLITGVEYVRDGRDQHNSAWISDPDDFAGILRATVRFAAWHTVEVAFDFGPDRPPKCVEVAFKVSKEGPDEITPADLREISLPELVAKVSPVAVAPPKRQRRDVDTDRLQRIADLYEAAGSGSAAIAEIRKTEHVSRSRAYALVQQCRDAGLIEGTEE